MGRPPRRPVSAGRSGARLTTMDGATADPPAAGSELPMELSTAVIILLVILAVVVIAMLAALVYVGVKLLRTYSLINDPRMSGGGKAAFWGAVIYTLSPIDLLPDPILLDDIGLVLVALTYITRKAAELGILEPESSGPDPFDRRRDVIDVQEAQPVDDVIDVDAEDRVDRPADDPWGRPRH